MFGITERDTKVLLDLAESAIRARLEGRPEPAVDLASLSPELRRPIGAFVTLHVGGALNGCIGNITASEPLAPEVARLALAAAFADPRLPALGSDELDRLDIDISLLSEPTGIPARSRHELLAHLRPGDDGLIIRSGRHQALFLPSVWRQLPQPDDFVDQLFRKARLRPEPWPTDLTASGFTTATVHRSLR